MRKSVLRLAAAMLALAVATPVGATVINFDSLTTGISVDGAGYSYDEAGFNLTNSIADANSFIVWGNSSGYNADPDGATLSHNYGTTTTTLTRIGGGTFTFHSIDLTEVYNNATSGNVEFRFTDALSTVWTQTVTLDSIVGLQTFTFNLSNLVAVQLTPRTTQGPWIQMDNIVLDLGGPAQVSEPAVVGILGLGLLGITGLRRRKA